MAEYSLPHNHYKAWGYLFDEPVDMYVTLLENKDVEINIFIF